MSHGGGTVLEKGNIYQQVDSLKEISTDKSLWGEQQQKANVSSWVMSDGPIQKEKGKEGEN